MAQDRFTIRLRRDSAARWAQANPVLVDGEPGYERDTGKLKVGDGFHHWLDLEYYVPRGGETEVPTNLEDHIYAELPHPVYDDGASFAILYENAKV